MRGRGARSCRERPPDSRRRRPTSDRRTVATTANSAGATRERARPHPRCQPAAETGPTTESSGSENIGRKSAVPNATPAATWRSERYRATFARIAASGSGTRCGRSTALCLSQEYRVAPLYQKVPRTIRLTCRPHPFGDASAGWGQREGLMGAAPTTLRGPRGRARTCSRNRRRTRSSGGRDTGASSAGGREARKEPAPPKSSDSGSSCPP